MDKTCYFKKFNVYKKQSERRRNEIWQRKENVSNVSTVKETAVRIGDGIAIAKELMSDSKITADTLN